MVFTRPQPQAPNLLGATGTGQHTGLSRALAGKDQLKTNLSEPCNSAEFFSERNFPSTVEQPVVTVYRSPKKSARASANAPETIRGGDR